MPYLAANVSVMDYGADPTGIADSTLAFNQALTAVNAAGGGVVSAPAGTFKITPTGSPAVGITFMGISQGYQGVRLVGAGASATTLQKAANGTLMQFSGPSSSPGTGSTHTKFCTVESIGFNGNNLTGNIFQCYYCDNILFRDVNVNSNSDIILDSAEFWDSRFYNCVFGGSGSTTANALTPNVLLRCSAAASGFGASTDTTNQIYFHGCRWEAFHTGALWVQQGVGSSSGVNGVFLTDFKMETSQINGGPHILVDTNSREIDFKHGYLFSGGFTGGYSTAQDVIQFSSQFGTLDDILISDGGSATVANGVTVNAPTSNQTVVVENVRATYTTAPTGAHLNFGGTNTGAYKISNVTSNNGTQVAGTVPTLYAANQPINISTTGPISDSSFIVAPPDGTIGIDQFDKRLYVRHSTGAWTRIPLNTVAFGVTSTVTIANSVANTQLQQSTNAAANEPQTGSTYLIKGYGVYSVTGTPTMQFNVYWGTITGTVIATIPAITAASGVTNAPFSYEVMITFRSTTSLTASITLDLVTNTTTGAITRYGGSPSTTTTVVTTSSTPIVIGFQWGTASASNTISLMGGNSFKAN
jgi:hypothetical protein